jgi:hypothetical protein
MSRISRFGLGGLGGLLPILATLVAVDLSSIATLIDQNQITVGLCVGYAIRVLGLFALGGIMAAINSEVTAPIALVQIGIAAPALVTSYMAGVEITGSKPPLRSLSSMIISTVQAEQYAPNRSVKVAGFVSDILKGIKPGLGAHPDTRHPVPGDATREILCKWVVPSNEYQCRQVPAGGDWNS